MQDQLFHMNQQTLLDMESRKRAQLINSITGFKSISLIGSKDALGATNLAIFNSIVHIGSNPALIGFISRPEAHLRHTVSNILETQFYTINHLHEGIFSSGHQSSARYPSDVSEFDACELTAEFKNKFHAPFVTESRIQMAVKLLECLPIKSNQTALIVGEIQDVYFPLDQLSSDGYLNIEGCGSLAGSGLDAYHKTQLLGRLPYAKP